MSKLFVVIALLLGLLFTGPGSAQAYHVGPLVQAPCQLGVDGNGGTGAARTLLFDDHGVQRSYLFNPCNEPDSYSLRGVHHFSVAPHSKVQYRSFASGNLYWSICGDEDTATYEYIGNSVRIEKVVYNLACGF